MSENTQDYYWNWEWPGLTLNYGIEETGVPATDGTGWSKGQPLTWDDELQQYVTSSDGTIIAVATADKAPSETVCDVKLFPVVKVPICGNHDRLNQYMGNSGRERNLTPLANSSWEYRANDRLTAGSATVVTPVSVKKLPDEVWEAGDEVWYIKYGVDADGNDFSGYWTNENPNTTLVSGYKLASYFYGGRAKPSPKGTKGLIGTQRVAADAADLWWIQQTSAIGSYPPHPNYHRKIDVPNSAVESEDIINGPVCLGDDGILTSAIRKNNIYQNKMAWPYYDWETDATGGDDDVKQIEYFDGIFCSNPSPTAKIYSMMQMDTGYMRQVGTYTCLYDTEEDFTIPASLGDDFFRFMKRYNMSLPIFCVDRWGAKEYQSFGQNLDFTPQPFSKTIPASVDPYGKLNEDIVVTWVPWRSNTVFGGRGVLMFPIVAKASHQSGGPSFMHSQNDFCGSDNKENLGKDYCKFLHNGNNWAGLSFPKTLTYKDPNRGFMRQPDILTASGFMVFPDENIPSDPSYNNSIPIYDYSSWTGDYRLYQDLWNYTDGSPDYNGTEGQDATYRRLCDDSDIKGRFFMSYPQHDDRGPSGDIGLDGRECYWKLQKAEIGAFGANTARTWTDYTSEFDITGNQVYTIPQGDGTPVAVWAVNATDVFSHIPWWDNPNNYRIEFRVVYYNRPGSPSNPYQGPFNSTNNYVNLGQTFGTRIPNFGVNFAEGGWWIYQFQGAIPFTTFKHHFTDVIANDGTTVDPSDPVLGNYMKIPDIGEWTWTGTMSDFVLDRNDNEYQIALGSGNIVFSVDNSEEAYCNDSTFQRGLKKKTYIMGAIEIEGRDGVFYSCEKIGAVRTAFLNFANGWRQLAKTELTEDDFGDGATWDGSNEYCIFHDMLDYEYKVRVTVRAFGQIGNERFAANPCQWYDVGTFEYTIPALEEVDLQVDDATSSNPTPGSSDTEITINVSSTAKDDKYPPSPTEQVTATITFKDEDGNVLSTLSNQSFTDNGDGSWSWSGSAPPFAGPYDGTITINATYSYTNYSFVPNGSGTFTTTFTPQSPTNPILTINNVTFS